MLRRGPVGGDDQLQPLPLQLHGPRRLRPGHRGRGHRHPRTRDLHHHLPDRCDYLTLLSLQQTTEDTMYYILYTLKSILLNEIFVTVNKKPPFFH